MRFGSDKKFRSFPIIISCILALCVSSILYVSSYALLPTPDAGALPAATATPDPSILVIPRDDTTVPPQITPAVPTPQPTSYNFSKVSSKKNSPCDVILILGDSRACSLIKALWDNDDYESLYYYADRTNAIDAICRKGNRMIVICAEPGGSIKSGAVDRAVGRLTSLLNNNENLQNQKSYTFFNMFGLNDCLLDGVTNAGYIAYDTKLIGLIPFCSHIYQLNAGPVSKNSEPVPDDALNAMIYKYNQSFKNTAGVTVVDLYNYLMTSGYHTEFSQIDVSGLHYDATTNVKIMNYILAVAYEAVSTPVLPGITPAVATPVMPTIPTIPAVSTPMIPAVTAVATPPATAVATPPVTAVATPFAKAPLVSPAAPALPVQSPAISPLPAQ